MKKFFHTIEDLIASFIIAFGVLPTVAALALALTLGCGWKLVHAALFCLSITLALVWFMHLYANRDETPAFAARLKDSLRGIWGVMSSKTVVLGAAAVVTVVAVFFVFYQGDTVLQNWQRRQPAVKRQQTAQANDEKPKSKPAPKKRESGKPSGGRKPPSANQKKRPV